jgi:2-oxoisovalerate dehydrogenase E1 component alpha subunit
MISYLNNDGELDPACPDKLSQELLLKGYKTMLKTRMVDERMITLQRQGQITFALSSLGEEACGAAVMAALESEDWIYPQYREPAALFYRGFSIENYLHHMFGNKKDLILGRQMPNHFGSRELNIVTCSSPIGTKIPHAAGAGYAMKFLNEQTISLVYFGEGSTSEGDFHAGVNFAAVRKTPTIFFCRNNGWAISTPAKEQFASDGILPKASGYGIKGMKVDGNDYFALYNVVKEAREHCLKEGPVLIEAMTYRMGAHSTSDDPSLYRKNEEERMWKEKDPINRLKLYLEKQSLWDEAKETAYVKEIKDEIDRAIKSASETEKSPLSTIVENVYENVTETLQDELKETRAGGK